MKEVIMLKGLPACGKSTWALGKISGENTNSWKRINKDELRSMLDNGKHSKGNESFVLEVRDMILMAALRAGKHVIIDDTNLHPKHEVEIKGIIERYEKESGKKVFFSIKSFNTSLEDCILRDSKRDKPVGEKVIRDNYNKYVRSNKVAERARAKQDESLPKAIICDLDGTLALLNGRDPYNASSCENDLLNEDVARIVWTYKTLQNKVFIFSGRSDEYKEETVSWLEKHDIPYDLLVMRPKDIKIKDADLKRGFFETYIKDKYFVNFVLDDRNQVVDMWRDIGLTCLQVAKGDF